MVIFEIFQHKKCMLEARNVHDCLKGSQLMKYGSWFCKKKSREKSAEIIKITMSRAILKTFKHRKNRVDNTTQYALAKRTTYSHYWINNLYQASS